MESTLDFCPVHMETFAIAPTLAPRLLSSVNMELPDASSYNPASTVQNDGRSAKKKKKKILASLLPSPGGAQLKFSSKTFPPKNVR